MFNQGTTGAVLHQVNAGATAEKAVAHNQGITVADEATLKDKLDLCVNLLLNMNRVTADISAKVCGEYYNETQGNGPQCEPGVPSCGNVIVEADVLADIINSILQTLGTVNYKL